MIASSDCHYCCQPLTPAFFDMSQNRKKNQTQAVIILAYTVVILVFLEYFGRPEFFYSQFPALSREQSGLYPLLWWAAWTIVLFLLLPAMIIKTVFKQRLVDFGFKLKIRRQYYALYLGMFLAVLPLVIYASTREDFRAIYPFFRGAIHSPVSSIIVWEAAYLSTFVALEFFFRGFLVLGLEKNFGRLAVWVAVIPYAMLHFHKPPLEAFGAIIAGLVLGEVAQRTRSILGGVFVHVGVAASMDFLALNRF
ncbi:MAG TPA: CPBP family intramembrane metalloprotease [Gammaproteobacteria bacterium]|nr:CPBP family intramembrane metalloprotease [Gammaproteobacteria bacterium]